MTYCYWYGKKDQCYFRWYRWFANTSGYFNLDAIVWSDRRSIADKKMKAGKISEVISRFYYFEPDTYTQTWLKIVKFVEIAERNYSGTLTASLFHINCDLNYSGCRWLQIQWHNSRGVDYVKHFGRRPIAASPFEQHRVRSNTSVDKCSAVDRKELWRT